MKRTVTILAHDRPEYLRQGTTAKETPMTTRDMKKRLLAVLAALALTATVAAPVQAYTFGPWTNVRYRAVSATECALAKTSANRRIGPLSPDDILMGCRTRVRQRSAWIVGWTGWSDRLFQIENKGPLGSYGMRETATVRWSGTRVHSSVPICESWAFLVKVTPRGCQIIGNDTGQLWMRMEYTASWDFLWANISRDRGAQLGISGAGWIGAVSFWP